MACVSKIGAKKEECCKSDHPSDIFCIISKVNYFRILATLNKKQSLNIQEISEVLHSNPDLVASYVKKLEVKRLLLQQTSGSDVGYSLNKKNRYVSLFSKLCS